MRQGRTRVKHVYENLKSDEPCILGPKSEISDWTAWATRLTKKFDYYRLFERVIRVLRTLAMPLVSLEYLWIVVKLCTFVDHCTSLFLKIRSATVRLTHCTPGAEATQLGRLCILISGREVMSDKSLRNCRRPDSSSKVAYGLLNPQWFSTIGAASCSHFQLLFISLGVRQD